MTQRQPHHPSRPIRLALFAGGLVFRRIPVIGDLPCGGRQRQGSVIALRRRELTLPPVLGDERHPLTCEIDRGGRTRSDCRGWAASPTALRVHVRVEHHDSGDHRGDDALHRASHSVLLRRRNWGGRRCRRSKPEEIFTVFAVNLQDEYGVAAGTRRRHGDDDLRPVLQRLR